MRRPSSTLPADVARDLDALDAALSGEPVAADQTDLAALALALRDDRPVPGVAFAAALDDRAAAGFPPVAGGRRRRPGASRWTWAGLGVVASGAAAAVLVVSLAGGGDHTSVSPAGSVANRPSIETSGAQLEAAGVAPTVTRATKRAPATPVRPAAPATADLAAPSTTPPRPVAPAGASTGAPARSVEQGASLRLATSPSSLDDVASGVVRVTDAAGGYVMSSNIDARSGTGGGAAFDLRIPATRLQTALAQLSRLAHVRSRTQSSIDVTGQVGSAAGRVASLRGARRKLVRELAAAASVEDAQAIREHLQSVDQRLAQAKATRDDLRRRVRYSAVAVEVATERARKGAVAGGGSWTPRDALHDAGRILGVVLGGLLVLAAAVLPLALLAGVAWPLVRGARRRRREHALDGT